MVRILAISLFSLFVSVSAYTQGTASDYFSFLPDSIRQELFSKGTVGDTGSSIGELKLWQSSPFASVIQASYGSNASTIAAESWFLLNKPAFHSIDEQNLKIFESFTAFSTMKGLLVYSESLKKMETFIYDSYRVDSLDTKQRLANPSETTAPNAAVYYLYQKEEQTGDIYSRMDYTSHGTWFEVTLTNETPLKYLILTLVKPRELKTTFYLVPLDDKIILYGITVAKTPTLFGLEKLKRKSFFNRMNALASWVQSNLQ